MTLATACPAWRRTGTDSSLPARGGQYARRPRVGMLLDLVPKREPAWSASCSHTSASPFSGELVALGPDDPQLAVSASGPRDHPFSRVFQPMEVDPRSPPARIRRSCRVQLRWNGVKSLAFAGDRVGFSHRSCDAALNTALLGKNDAFGDVAPQGDAQFASLATMADPAIRPFAAPMIARDQRAQAKFV